MLGRKIIEVYPDENAPEPDTTSIGKDNNSLPVRRLRSAGLRIITENDVTNVNYLQVSGNVECVFAPRPSFRLHYQVPNARRRRDSSNSGGTSILLVSSIHCLLSYLSELCGHMQYARHDPYFRIAQPHIHGGHEHQWTLSLTVRCLTLISSRRQEATAILPTGDGSEDNIPSKLPPAFLSGCATKGLREGHGFVGSACERGSR